MSAIFDRMWFGKKGLIGGMDRGSKPAPSQTSANTSGSGSSLMGQEKKSRKRKIVGVTRTQ